jgi:hypothetical protein
MFIYRLLSLTSYAQQRFQSHICQYTFHNFFSFKWDVHGKYRMLFKTHWPTNVESCQIIIYNQQNQMKQLTGGNFKANKSPHLI